MFKFVPASACRYATVYVWRSEDNIQEEVYHVGPRDWTRVSRHEVRWLDPLNVPFCLISSVRRYGSQNAMGPLRYVLRKWTKHSMWNFISCKNLTGEQRWVPGVVLPARNPATGGSGKAAHSRPAWAAWEDPILNKIKGKSKELVKKPKQVLALEEQNSENLEDDLWTDRRWKARKAGAQELWGWCQEGRCKGASITQNNKMEHRESQPQGQDISEESIRK